jgi:hypothetical protein
MTACTNDYFTAIESKLHSLLQKMDVACTENTMLRTTQQWKALSR